VIPLYSYETDELSMIITFFSSQNNMVCTVFMALYMMIYYYSISLIQINKSVYIYDAEIVNTLVPVLNYTVQYIGNDPISIGDTFNIDTQDQHLCNDSEGAKVCKHEYDNLTSLQSACRHQTETMIVSVSATNVFGHGPAINTSIGNCMNMLLAVSHQVL
jgi:hypothetical protein